MKINEYLSGDGTFLRFFTFSAFLPTIYSVPFFIVLCILFLTNFGPSNFTFVLLKMFPAALAPAEVAYSIFFGFGSTNLNTFYGNPLVYAPPPAVANYSLGAISRNTLLIFLSIVFKFFSINFTVLIFIVYDILFLSFISFLIILFAFLNNTFLGKTSALIVYSIFWLDINA